MRSPRSRSQRARRFHRRRAAISRSNKKNVFNLRKILKISSGSTRRAPATFFRQKIPSLIKAVRETFVTTADMLWEFFASSFSFFWDNSGPQSLAWSKYDCLVIEPFRMSQGHPKSNVDTNTTVIWRRRCVLYNRETRRKINRQEKGGLSRLEEV